MALASKERNDNRNLVSLLQTFKTGNMMKLLTTSCKVEKHFLLLPKSVVNNSKSFSFNELIIR